MNPAYPLVSARANHRCEYCHAPELVFNFPFEVEHILPLRHGGIDSAENLALACRSCNLRKGIHTTGMTPDSPLEVRLFNPREDHWHQHFQVVPDSGALLDITAIGYATLTRLQMNSIAQRSARRLWMQLGLFP
ncbi:MAG: HNH endonuclease [Candidatus Contendobacter sp.]|jgi:hypothetical protein|nr:HNH endonuclease [Candidatus Contendobacter sp.]